MKKLFAAALALMLALTCTAFAEQAETVQIGEYACATPEGWTATETAENYYTYTLDDDTVMIVQYYAFEDMGVTREDFATLGYETDFDIITLYQTGIGNVAINDDGDTMYATENNSYATAGEDFSLGLYHGALSEAVLAGNYASCLVLSPNGLLSVLVMSADATEDAAVEMRDTFLKGVFSGETCLGEYVPAEYTPAAVSEEEIEAAPDAEAVEEGEKEAGEAAIGGGVD
ncbi:MAG: hypothetical protein Q4C31_01380 [Eubacteriales bacterium]|nr:hypothetical protein [Eubacteriales bacterium]